MYYCGYMQWEGNNSLIFLDFLSWMVFPGAEKWGIGECLGQKRKMLGISGHFCACGNPSSVCPSSSRPRPPPSHWVPPLSKNNQVTKGLISVLLSVLSHETTCLKGVDMAKLSYNRSFSCSVWKSVVCNTVYSEIGFQLKKGSTGNQNTEIRALDLNSFADHFNSLSLERCQNTLFILRK